LADCSLVIGMPEDHGVPGRVTCVSAQVQQLTGYTGIAEGLVAFSRNRSGESKNRNRVVRLRLDESG